MSRVVTTYKCNNCAALFVKPGKCPNCEPGYLRLAAPQLDMLWDMTVIEEMPPDDTCENPECNCHC